jgi:hypothetical protein
LEWKNSCKQLDNGRVEILDRCDKRECSSNIDKASSATSDINNGCSRTGLGSGININFCPVINPTISLQFNPLAQQYNLGSNLLSVNYPIMVYGRWKENMSHQSSNR